MPTLTPIEYSIPELAQAEDPHIQCEICKADVPKSEARSIIVQYAAPGKDVGAFSCPAVQHWACSHEHAKLAAIACIEEHLEYGPHAGKGGQ